MFTRRPSGAVGGERLAEPWDLQLGPPLGEPGRAATGPPERSRIRRVVAAALAGAMMMAMSEGSGAAGGGDPQAAPGKLPASGRLVNSMRQAKRKIFDVHRCRRIEGHEGRDEA